ATLQRAHPVYREGNSSCLQRDGLRSSGEIRAGESNCRSGRLVEPQQRLSTLGAASLEGPPAKQADDRLTLGQRASWRLRRATSLLLLHTRGLVLLPGGR